MMNLWKKEPGLVVAFAVAALHAAVLLGWRLNHEQEMGLGDAAKELVLLVGAAFVARSQTSPAASGEAPQ